MPRCPSCGCPHCPARRTTTPRIIVPGGSKEVTRRRRICRDCGFSFYTREEDEEEWARLEEAGLSLKDVEAIKRGEMEDPTGGPPLSPSEAAPEPEEDNPYLSGTTPPKAPPPSLVVPPRSGPRGPGRNRGRVKDRD